MSKRIVDLYSLKNKIYKLVITPCEARSLTFSKLLMFIYVNIYLYIFLYEKMFIGLC